MRIKCKNKKPNRQPDNYPKFELESEKVRTPTPTGQKKEGNPNKLKQNLNPNQFNVISSCPDHFLTTP